jgi:hypothetical protein
VTCDWLRGTGWAAFIGYVLADFVLYFIRFVKTRRGQGATSASCTTTAKLRRSSHVTESRQGRTRRRRRRRTHG